MQKTTINATSKLWTKFHVSNLEKISRYPVPSAYISHLEHKPSRSLRKRGSHLLSITRFHVYKRYRVLEWKRLIKKAMHRRQIMWSQQIMRSQLHKWRLKMLGICHNSIISQFMSSLKVQLINAHMFNEKPQKYNSPMPYHIHAGSLHLTHLTFTLNHNVHYKSKFTKRVYHQGDKWN